MTCKASARVSFLSVGLSRGAWVFKAYKTTSLAFALRLTPVDAASISPTGFHVKTHLDLSSCPSGILWRKMRRTVSVASHCDSSFSLALSNCMISSGVKFKCLILLQPVDVLHLKPGKALVPCAISSFILFQISFSQENFTYYLIRTFFFGHVVDFVTS